MSKSEEQALSNLGLPNTSLAEAFAKWLEHRQADKVLRDVVADNRHEMHKFDASNRVDLKREEQAGAQRGWRDSPQLTDWQHSVGIDKIDRLVDAQDAINRAERAEQLAKAKRGGTP